MFGSHKNTRIAQPALTSSLAIAAALAFAPQVRAQSFDATSTLLAGSATVTTGTNTTTITVNTPTAVLQWTPNDTGTAGTINFQPANTTATFQGTPTSGNFAVLNNIVPTTTSRPIAFNGNVVSRLQDAAGNVSPGGTVFFYSPGGILVGSGATIDVGNLGLTTSPVAYDSQGEFRTFDAVTGAPKVTFGQAQAGSFVNVQPGAAIFAGYQNGNPFADGSYVALVAPSVRVGGAVHVDGSAALVAADASTITFSPDGLFDISVDVPTSALATNGAPLAVDPGGVITGPAASSSGTHAAYLVTAPRNTMLTLMVSGGASLGFDVAGAADVVGNRVVLSGGFNVSKGVADETTVVGGTGGTINVVMNGASATSQVNISASGQGTVQSNATTLPANLASGLSVHALDTAFLATSSGGVLTIAGNVDLRAIDPGSLVSATGNVTAGGARIFAQGVGSQINLNGASVTVRADASAAAVSTAGGVGGNATGGLADVFANAGGSVLIAGDLTLSADGRGASVNTTGGSAGNGTGGRADIDAYLGNATVSVGGSTFISAQGVGGDCGDATCLTGGGTGTGGSAFISARALNVAGSSGSSVNLGVSTQVEASGAGGLGVVVAGGNGQGGQAQVFADNANQVTAQGSISVTASGQGGSAQGPGIKAGTGKGGSASVFVTTNGQVALSGSFPSISVDAGGFGGNAFLGRAGQGTDPNGGDGIGGTAQVTANGGSITGADDISLGADGDGGFAFGGSTTGTGGNGLGGNTFVNVTKDLNGNTGSLSTNYLSLYANAFGGSGIVAGSGTGGSSNVTVRDASVLTVLNDLRIDASASGGNGLTDINTFIASAGSAGLTVSHGGQALITGDAFLNADGEGGSFGAAPVANAGAGSGRGGNVFVQAVDTGAVIDIGGGLRASADGFATHGFCSTGCTVDAGNGRGGTLTVIANQGTVTPGGGSTISVGTSGGGVSFLSASGFGSFGVVSNGGTGTGGSVSVAAGDTTGSSNPNSVTFANSLDISADGTGGDQGGTGTVAQPLAGGLGTGGSVFVAANTGGSLTTTSNLNLSAAGRGGDGNNDTGGGGASGGAGVGGSATLLSSGGTAAFGGLVSVAANATGGTAFSPDASGFGGNAAGGTATVSARNGTTAVSGTLAFAAPLVVRSDATGGDGLNGGNGTGGLALVVAANGTITGGSVAIESSGSGGNGMASIDPATDGIVVGNGGIGTGGAPVTDTAGNVITDGGSQLVARTGQPVTGYAAGTIAFDSVELDSNGVGGAGGDAFSFDQPVNGGKGGDGFGGQTLALASAGNGTLSVNNLVQAFAVGSGGRGGNGSDSPAGDGGNGGAGGMGVGGNAQVGTQSGAASPNNLGQAQFGGIITVVNANGGSGGDGGNPTSSTGTFVQGLGGDGGAAFDGGTTLLVRGSPVTITGTPSSSGTGSVSLNANAFGGNGGNGRQQGVGGDATVGSTTTSNGGVAVLVTNRFQFPTQAGSLVANDISGGASAFGGAGSTAGNTIVGDQPLLFSAVNSNVTATDIGLFASGTAPTTSVIESPIALVNSTVNISNTLNFSSSGPISLSLDNSALNVQNAFLGGSDFVLPATQPTTIGTFTITNGPNAGFHINSGANFFAYSNFVFPFDVSFSLTNGSIRLDDISGGNAFFADASGSIQLGNLAVSDLGLSAATTITIGNVNAVGNAQVFGDVSLDAGGTITTGNIATPTGLVSISSGAAVQTGGITASNDLVEIFATGDVTASGPISAGTNVVVNSGGSIFVQNVTGGTAQATQSSGNYDVQLVAANQIGVGNVTTPSLALISAGFTIGTGSIAARDALILGNGATTVSGGINATGQVLFANSSMTSLGGTPGAGYNSAAVFNAAPVSLGGPITILGPVAASLRFLAATTNGFSSGSIAVSNGPLTVLADGPIATGSLSSATDISVQSSNGSIQAGNIAAANGAISLFNAGSGDIAVGGMTASSVVQIRSAGNLNTGDISVSSGPILISLPGDASLGTLNAGGFININAGGFIGTRDITTPSNVVLVAGQSGAAPLTVSGNITASDIFLASQGTIRTGNLTATAATSPSSSGSYQVFVLSDGGSTVGNVQADDLVIMASPQSITSGTITSGNGVGLFATGSIDSGSITAPGKVVLADNAMYFIGENDAGYDLNAVFNAARINGTGDYLVGDVSAAGLKVGTFGQARIGNIAANGLVDVFGGTSVTTAFVDTPDFVNLASGGDITTLDIGSSQPPAGVSVTGNGFVTTGAVTSAGSVLLSGNTGLQAGNVSGGSDVTLAGGSGPLTAGNVTGTSLVANGGALSIGSIGSNTFVSVSGNSVLLGSVDAGTYVDISGGSIGISGLIDASDTVDLNATGDIAVFGPILSGGDITAVAGGAIDVNDVSAGFNRGNVAGATRNIGLAAGTSLTAGNLTAAGGIGVLAQTTLTTGSLSAVDMLVLAHGDIVTGALAAQGRLLVADASMAALGGQIGANFNPAPVFAAVPVATAGSVTFNGPAIASALQVRAGTNITAGNVTGRFVAVLNAGNNLTLGNLDAGTIAALITQTGDINVANVTAGTTLNAPAPTDGHLVAFSAGRSITAGNISASEDISIVARTGTMALGTLTAPKISVLGRGDIAIQAIGGNGTVRIDDASLSSLISATNGSINLQSVFNADPVRTAGAIAIASPVQAFDFQAAAGTTFTAPAISATGYVQINAGDVAVNAIDAGADALVIADNAITVGNVTSGTVLQSPITTDTHNIGLIAGGALRAGNVTALDVVGLSGATIAAGNLSSNEMLILGHGDIGVGRIAAIGRVLIADQSMLPIGGTIGTNNSDYDPNLVFSATPVRTAGTVTIDGRLSTVGNAVDGSDLTIASGGDVTVIGNMFGTGQTRIDSGGGFSQTGGVIGLPLGSLTVAASGPVTTQQVTVGGQNGAPGAIAITTTGAVSTGQLGATNGVAITAGSSLTTGNVFTSGGNVVLSGGAAVQAGNVTANSGSVSIAAGTTLTAAAIRAATTLSLSAPGAISVGVLGGNSLNAVGAITVNGGDITIAQGNQVFSSQSSVTLTSTGNVTTGVVSGQTGVTITATGNIDTGGHGANTGPTTLTAGGSVRTGQINSAGIVVNAGTTFQSGNLDSSNGISITTGGGLATSFLSSAGSIVLKSGAGLSAGQIRTVSGDIQSSSVGNSNIFSFISAGKVDFSAQGSFTASRPITAVGQINGQSAGAMTLSDVTSSGGGISLASSGALTTGNLSSFADLTISGGPSVTTGTLATTGAAGTTTSSVSVTSGGTLSTGAINAATDVTITAPNAAIVPGTSGVGAITAGRNIVINAASFSSTQPLSSNGGLTITTAGPLALGSITARQSVQLTSGASISAGPIQVQFGVVANAGTTLTLGAITANGGVVLTSGGAMQLGGVTTISPIVLSSGGTLVSSGFLTSSNNLVIGVAQGDMSLAGVAAGTIELSSAASINTGLLRATGNAVVIAGQSLTVSQAQALQLALLAGNSITTGPLLAGITVDPTTGQITGATGRILIANASQGALGGKFGQGTYDFNAVFNATPVLAAGTVTVNGTVTAGEFRSYSQGNMSAQVVNAFNNIEVQSGGLVTVGQRWTSPDLTIISNDIDIQPSRAIQPTPTNPNPGNTTAGLNAGKAGDIVLLSTNANGQFVGDGLTVGSGYGLSGAEFALINSGSVVIGAQDVQANAIDQTIGNLAITGPQAGSTIDDPNGTVLFATGDVASQTPGTGGIKIVGAITAKGFLATNSLAFETGTIEMDVTKGSIAVTDSAGALAGNITIDADRIHFAEQSILDKLRVDPFYVGHVQDLNTPPATPPSGPVISAAKLEFVPKQTLYIQNTGTQQVQAGFLAPSNGLTIEPSPPAQNQTVSVTINGQFSNGGTTPNTTGSDAFTQFVTQDKLSNISSDSQFNTCSLAGSSCAGPLADMPPQPDISNTIQVLQTNTLPEPPIAEDPQSEEQKDTSTKEEQAEEKAATAAKSPIAPPAPLVDTRPLNPPVTVDEPVAGSGNPALIDTIRPIQGGSQ